MKKRLDILVYEKKLSSSREKSKLLIMEGRVFVDNQKADKPGDLFDENSSIFIKHKEIDYVSRGGLKLEKAIKNFEIDLKGKIALDVGASTGGFTDCMLKNGVSKVYCVDVGYGQLDWNLRNDPRVVNFERTNIRYIDKSLIKDAIEFFSVDVSFISLSLVLPVVYDIVKVNAIGVCLIKPQFEAGKDKVGKKGVVRDKKVHIEVIEKIVNLCFAIGFSILKLDFSPIKGPQGNIEYLLFLKKEKDPVVDDNLNIEKIVKETSKI